MLKYPRATHFVNQQQALRGASPYGASCRRTNVSLADPERSARSAPGSVLTRFNLSLALWFIYGLYMFDIWIIYGYGWW